jgi:ATP-binding cassette subfamily B multidrug efflux pump
VKQKTRTTGIGSLKALIPYLRAHAWVLAAGFAFMLAQNYGAMKVPSYFQKILDEVTGANRSGVVWGLIGWTCLYAGITVVALYLMRRLIIGVSRSIEYSLRQRIHARLLELDYSFFQAHETGDLVSRTTNDLDNVRTLLGPGVMYIPNSLSMFVFFFPVLFRLNGVLMLVVGGVLALVIVLILVILPRMEPLYRRIQEATGAINSRVWQVVSGISTVKLHTMEPREEHRFEELNRDFLGRTMATARVQELLWPVFSFVFAITELIIILVGGRFVIEGSMTLGQLLQFNVMITTLTFPVLSLGWIMSLLQQGMSAMGRINAILDGPSEIRNDWKRLDSEQLAFEVRDLTFTYPGQTRPAVRHASLTIAPGEFIGLTGTIGSGKSTLVSLLTGLHRPPRGTVFVNGIDIMDIEPAQLLARMGIVSQSPFLFSRTLAENIALGAGGADGAAGTPGTEAGIDAVREAATLAGLSRDIASFANGYDQLIGERGIALSGGQKQRAAIARALMKPGTLIILDDALSSVDARTETAIIENLVSLRSRKTLIVVSHRISPLKAADRIYVMDDGAVAEVGTHSALAAGTGLYSRLVRLQQLEKTLASEPTQTGGA